MSLDLGVVNFAAVSLFTANRDINYVISAKKLKHNINKLDNKIDNKKKELCVEVIKTIQSKKDKKEQLTRQELNLLSEYYKSINNNEKLNTYQENKHNITSDYIHKLSKYLIDDCVNKNIKLIIVGKNKGWKQEINHGTNNNRNMYNFPHAKFIEILKYKALLQDIVVIETEESYTSKTSFIDNEVLKVFTKQDRNRNRNKSKVKEEINLTQGKESQLSNSNSNSKVINTNKLSGKRINQVFITKDKKKIHADINGSFNIIRKVLTQFVYDKNLINLEYHLMELKLYGKKKLCNFHHKHVNNQIKNKIKQDSERNFVNTVVGVANNLTN